jgi:hypothetical protein
MTANSMAAPVIAQGLATARLSDSIHFTFSP